MTGARGTRGAPETRAGERAYPRVRAPMREKLTPEQRIERLRLLNEHQALDRLVDRTPSQLRRLADLERLLESTRARPVERPSRGKPLPAAAGR